MILTPRPCDSCGAAVYDLLNDRTGKRAPIDALATPYGGTVRIDWNRDDPESSKYHVLNKAERAARVGVESPEPMHRSHFATCPSAQGWRRK